MPRTLARQNLSNGDGIDHLGENAAIGAVTAPGSPNVFGASNWLALAHPVTAGRTRQSGGNRDPEGMSKVSGSGLGLPRRDAGRGPRSAPGPGGRCRGGPPPATTGP